MKAPKPIRAHRLDWIVKFNAKLRKIEAHRYPESSALRQQIMSITGYKRLM